MEITSNYQIAVANLAIALSEDTVSTEQREEIAKAVGNDIDRLIDVTNAYIVNANAKMYAGKLTAAKAKSYIKAEYKAIGFGNVLDYKYLEKPFEVFYDRKAFAAASAAEQLKKVKEVYERNQTCPNERIKCGVDSYALRLLYNFGLITEDIGFAKEIMETINGYSTEQKELAILPPAIITEL